MSEAIDDLAKRIAREYVETSFVRPHGYECDDGTGSCTFTELNGARCQLPEKDHFPSTDERRELPMLTESQWILLCDLLSAHTGRPEASLREISEIPEVADLYRILSNFALTADAARINETIRRTREDGLREAYRVNREHLELDHDILQAIWRLHQAESGQHPGFCGACLHELPCPTQLLYGGKFD